MWGRQTVLISVAQSQQHQPRAAKQLVSLLLDFKGHLSKKQVNLPRIKVAKRGQVPQVKALRMEWLSRDWGSQCHH